MSSVAIQNLEYLSLVLILILDSSKQMDIKFMIYENIPINSKVGDLSSTIVKLKLNKPQLQVQYCDKNHFDIEFFYLNSSDASINTHTEIDREIICSELSGTSNDCFVTLGVTINQYLINIYIYILDINDNSPKFQKSEKYFKILESESTNFQIKLDQAIDLDSAQNGVYHYSLECLQKSHRNYFTLNRTLSLLSLVLIKSLDYESIPKFVLQLIACDRGQPQLCSSQKLIIDIIDLNDEAPKFLVKNYTKVVFENLPVGSVILKVHAIDREAGDFGRIIYKLINHQDFSTSFVSIDANSGMIILKKHLFDIDKLTLTVEAHDSAEHNSKFDWAHIVIFIIDINNHRPNISVGSDKRSSTQFVNGYPLYFLEIFENNPENFEISFINVVDKDDGKNGDVKCQIKTVTNNLKDLFYLDIRMRLNKNTFQYKLRIRKSLDREKISNPLNLTIHCQDNGQPILKSTIILQINVLDQNEYPALFTKSNYAVSITEEKANISILSFAVIDQDAMSFNEFYLNSSNNFNIENFHLNSLTQSSGEIRIGKPLDREKFNKFQFFIFVINKAQNKIQISSSAIVSIVVLDINDNIPQYVGRMSFEMKENNEPFHTLGAMNFNDKDINENSLISISSLSTICYGPTENFVRNEDLFQISETKILQVKQSLDYELIHNCKIDINFHDEGFPRNSNKVTIIVNLLDENDNDPEWIYPSNLDYVVNISHINIKAGTRLTRVRAIDADSVSSSKLTYELKNKLDSITIDSITGEISLTKDIDAGKYDLFIQVTDNGNPIRNASANLTIYIYSQNILQSINSITRAVLTIIFIPAFVIVFSSGFFIFIVLFLKRRHRSNNEFQSSKSSVVKKNRNFSKNPYKSAQRTPLNQYKNVSPELIMTSLQNPYYFETDLESELPNENENIPNNIAQLFLKKSMKPDCEVCSSADSGQGASEEEILLYNYKSMKPEKLSSQQLSNYIFPPLMEEDNNSFFYTNSTRTNKLTNGDESEICNCYNQFVNQYAESECGVNILSLLQCPVHNQLLPLMNSQTNTTDDNIISNTIITSDINGFIN